MKTKINIGDYVVIKNSKIYKNEEKIFEDSDNLPIADLLKKMYKGLELDYSKFFKMDLMSKLAFIGASTLLKDKDTDSNTAILFSNRAASLDTDRKHHISIVDPNDYYPSPAVFVYTLPNIAIGEISIKYNLKSENAFFIFDTFNASFMHGYAESLLSQHKADQILCGWIEIDGPKYEAFLYVVGPNTGRAHTIAELNKLYQNKY